MAAWRYETSLLVEEEFHISVRPCISSMSVTLKTTI